MERLFWHIIAGILTIFLVVRFIPGVALEVIPGKSIYFGIEFDQQWKLMILVGGILGLINFFIKPILDKITIPLKILTLGLFSLILNMGLIWFLEIVFEEFVSPSLEAPKMGQWLPIIQSLDGIREADFVFERGKLYVRKAAPGYLMFFLSTFTPSAMLRLNCDILLPSLKNSNTPKGLGRLFKKK